MFRLGIIVPCSLNVQNVEVTNVIFLTKMSCTNNVQTLEIAYIDIYVFEI